MKFTTASVLAAAGVSAHHGLTTAVITEVAHVSTTYCSEPTHVVHNATTHVMTKPGTLIIPDCPCATTRTVTVPVRPASSPADGGVPSGSVNPPGSPAPSISLTLSGFPAPSGSPAFSASSSATGGVAGFTNSTVPAGPNPTAPSGRFTSGGPNNGPSPTAPAVVPTAGAGKAAVLSGAGLAGLVGLAAFAL